MAISKSARSKSVLAKAVLAKAVLVKSVLAKTSQSRAILAKDGPWIITANRLVDGRVVYFGNGRGWVEGASEARLLSDGPACARAMVEAATHVGDNLIVEPVAIAAALENGRIVPVRLRERIRDRGPSVSPFDPPYTARR